jgi:hypothetical protein
MNNKVAVNNPNTNKKDLVDYIGINGLFIVAIISYFFFGGSIVAMLGTICGIAGLIYLIKRRKILSNRDKYSGWGLFILWIIVWIFVASKGNY